MAHSQPESFDPELLENAEALENPIEEAPPAVHRRDENSISFRHFLQQQTDVVASRHHNPRSANAGAVDLVDVTIALPDFVQDHMVLEAQAFAESNNEHGNPSSDAPLDLSILHQVLPEFTSSHRNHNCSSRRVEEESFGAHSTNSGSQSQSATLPDFLSDGPMPMYVTSNSDSTISNSNQQYGPPPSASGNLENRSEVHQQRSQSVDTDSQNYQIERLRRELTEKTRSITHLQNEVHRQRSEILSLKEALLAEKLREASSLSQNCFQRGGSDGEQASSSRNLQDQANLPMNGRSPGAEEPNNFSSQVVQIAEASESLIRKLMQQINCLKEAAARSERQEKGLDQDK